MINKILRRLKKIKYNRAISSKSIEKRFSNIYSKGIWKSNGQSNSGYGSSLEATERLRKFIPDILNKVKATNIVDIGCGDFYWMKEVDLPCKYIGLDIVREVIEENKEMYENENHQFILHNAIDEELPEESDFVMCREVLFHLSFEDGVKVIKKVLQSNARYFLVTTSDNVQQNIDIKTGEFRNIDLTLPPYNFPKSIDRIRDSSTVSKHRYISLWDISQIRDSGNY